MNMGSKSQYQRGLLTLRTLGYSDEHIEQVQGLVDSVMADYDAMLREMVRRLALTTAALTKTSLNAAAGGCVRSLVEDNDEIVAVSLEFLARRTFDRVPFPEITRYDQNTRKADWEGPKTLDKGQAI